VFARRAAKGFQPIYIGKTTKSFEKEAFEPHKVATHYTPALMNKGKGTLVMFFVIPKAPCPSYPSKQIAELELYLIQTAARKNKKLSNILGAQGPQWTIDGILRSNRGRPTAVQKAFKSMIGLAK
jgi:hypothetical protein